MADASVNTVVPGTSTRDDHGIQVLREIGELMLMERAALTCKSNEERYNLLMVTVDRELPYAQEITSSAAKGTDEYRRWERDMQRMEKIDNDLANLPSPAISEMIAKPLRGGETAYQYQVSGGRSIGTIEADHTPNVLPPILRPRIEKAYYDAARPLRTMHRAIRRVLARYHIWDWRTEVATRLSDFSEEQGQRLLDSAYVEATPGEMGIPGESATADSDDDGDDDDIGFMDPEGGG